MKTKTKILITGGAGYIGSHVVAFLGEQDFDLTIYDNLSTGLRDSVLFGKFIHGDLADLDKLEATIVENKIDSVIHFAGSIIVPESVIDPLKYYDNNTKNSLSLIKLCIKHNISNFIFSSTAAVYGVGNGGGLTENSQLGPINPYGRSKLITEWMLEDVARAHPSFNYVALRYFNVAGADLQNRIGQCSPNATHLIKVALQVALGKRDHLDIFGTDYNTPDGTCIRDYIHVTDLAAAHFEALRFLTSHKTSQIFNCGYGSGFSVKQVIDCIKKITGVNFKVNEIGRRDGDAGLLISIPDKIKKMTQWNPKYADLELIVKSAYQWEQKLLRLGPVQK